MHTKEGRAKKKAILVAARVGFMLALLKFAVGLLTGSLAVMASALDSIFDALVSVINYAAVRLSLRRPTKKFKYGFGKIEGVAGQLQGVIIIISGLGLGVLAYQKIQGSGEVEHLGWGLVAMLISAFITYLLCRHLRKESARLHSVILKAESEHYFSDVLANIAVLVGILALFFTGQMWIDGLISIFIAGIIIWTGVKVFYESVCMLMDHQIQDDRFASIRGILLKAVKASEIQHFHHLRSRRSGVHRFVDVHIVFLPETSVSEARKVCVKIEKAIGQHLGEGGEVLIHLESKI